MFEYKEFRSNILDSLEDKIFDKPLCEVMHNQKYFNGIGNYLRAEIIFRSVRKKNNNFFFVVINTCTCKRAKGSVDFENIFDQSLDSKRDFIRFPDPSITAECRFIHLFGPAFGLCV